MTTTVETAERRRPVILCVEDEPDLRCDIVEEFGVASTVTFHLRNLFRKAQASRQADLIALFPASPVMLQPEW
ncbi:hypothetical protein QNA08_17990 [Chelatococcus sp. SYSU_G07232]|uniref:Response regulatory domain-containing protein n=1 Tax=Chelatococcus albus TaxID=3047466 RepID=A0ABT7ANG9_9HYPH|nr:hypothetical protein [Chelatococcus sp. SYSU_G07232]MDJ1160106.1 hypothetical protein [Chelatococcus sp. SYSU_G07232]